MLALILAIVMGVRSAGVILMAGMLICPAIAARPLSKSLFQHLFFAGLIGAFCGFLGNFLSYTLPNGNYSLPTGPMILLSSATICLLSLLLAPHTGLFSRYLQRKRFQKNTLLENGLKAVWKNQGSLPPHILHKLKKKKWVGTDGKLTPVGEAKARRLIRLHRLWEVYLVDYLGQSADKVHRTAEELEHFFSPELEKQLVDLLQNPQRDPHHQPIPPGETP